MSDLEDALEASLADKGIRMFPTKEAVGPGLPGEDSPNGSERREYIAQVDRERGVSREVLSEVDPWEAWADAMQTSVDKLLSESKTYKLAIVGLAGGVGLALIVAGASMKIVGKVAQGMQMLSANQEEIVKAMQGQVAQSNDVPPYNPANDPTVAVDSTVAEPYEGPATGATQQQRDLMSQDGPLGSALKGEMPTPE